ncbi:flagellar biosynthesis regulator FlaF [Candidatus Liberibacter americanus]|uniref:Flagellar biosynthesis regulator FlaF n=1 Tax=Candidatus Liberibacter americanus str. Sao Paulo TaxID=1261131 RepID=U6B4D9_9HYPH|nr:flagellar biosynthesis regulator FlaF [Candidatus Liberibacter americanus]AHA27760.1 Flagellar biosynthesis regulator FlaF [Candidatus Liberibacter americanus str. Sao Paulo]EMS36145.1 flagellar biosynthesis regulatory protein FlaF [Candidatus Liberibacter americanus PW_SP]
MRQYYNEIVQGSSEEARKRELWIINESISLLSNAKECEKNSIEIVKALFYTTRVWTIFVQDLISENNQLPNDLKLNLISIGLWILEECALIRRNKSDNYQGIIDISAQIRDGLK